MIFARISSFRCFILEGWGQCELIITSSKCFLFQIAFKLSIRSKKIIFLHPVHKLFNKIFWSSRDHKLRVIRPFVYVREKYLRQFVSTQNLPASTNIISLDLTKERQRIKQVLTQQEILFPKLFASLRSALHPLIGFQIKECEVKYRRRFKSKDNDDCSENETDEEPVGSGDSMC